jgi:hypothetical protein
MRSRLGAGVVGGLIAGVVFGMMMTVMRAPTPHGGSVRVITMIATIVGSTSVTVGWLYHLVNSAVIGGLFGLLLGTRIARGGNVLVLGAVYGLVWWMVGGLVLMPLLLGMPPFAPLLMPPMRMLGAGSMMGHAIFGLILGFSVARLETPAVPYRATA